MRMETTRRLPWSLIVIWLVSSSLAVLCSCLRLQGAHWNGEYLPMSADSFYHARRILDTVHDFGSFYEFDRRIHAPEGSLIWPWGYDYAMALIVRAGLAAGVSDEPMAILIWIPVCSVSISVALLIVIARQLELSTVISALAALCLAIAPTTQLLHGAGLIDQRHAEFIFILAALATGLSWLRKPASMRRAAAAAAVLGLAPAVQNGLFIIQLPLLFTGFLLWSQGRSMPLRSGGTFAVALLLVTIAILLPSLSFRMGRFELHTLSWLHCYVATCSAVIMILLSRLQATRTGLIALLAASCLLLIPILREVAFAQSISARASEYLRPGMETQSPLLAAELFGPGAVAVYYSHLIWIAPLSATVCAIKCSRERNSHRLLFWITCLIGLALLLSQVRMQYFGSIALYLPWLILLQQLCEQFPHRSSQATLFASAVILLLYCPLLGRQLNTPVPTANDVRFRETRPILAILGKACAEDPGVVLADTDVAHYIRYYTECSVIAGNFPITPEHVAKLDELHALNALTPRQLIARVPQVKYVLARPHKITPAADGSLDYQFLVNFPRLSNALLRGSQDTLPPEFILLHEVRLPALDNAVYARLYKLHRVTPVNRCEGSDGGGHTAREKYCDEVHVP